MSETNHRSVVGRQLILRDVLAYQEGAVVSRTLVDKTAGTVTIFAFDDGQGLSEHAAPFDAMVVVLDGKVEIKIAGNPFRLAEGEMIILPANRPHSVRALARFKMLLIMIRSEDKPSRLVSEPPAEHK
jgi:quercetin dioxygenase-like cupin family protein